jgi:signal transduction histidine kinase/ligand-binding sensor domain-containing protein
MAGSRPTRNWQDRRVLSIVEDAQSTVWAGTVNLPNAHLCAIRSTVECAGQDGRFGLGVFSLLEEGGRLWVGAASGLWRWRPGDPKHYPMANSTVSDLMRLESGALLVSMPEGIRQLAGDALATFRVPGLNQRLRPTRLFSDRDRGVWIGTQAGLLHLRDGQSDEFTRSDGLSGNTVVEIFEDREGNIWVGTNEGLDRFREMAVTSLARETGMPPDLVSSVLLARDRSVYIGAPIGLVRWSDGHSTTYRRREGLPDDRVGSLFEDSAGRVLVATFGGMAVFDRGRITPLPGVRTRVVYGIAEERPGEFWISDQEQGLLRLVGEKVVSRIPWSALGRDDHATAVAFDRTRAGVWLGFYKGGVIFVQGGTTRESYGTDDGLPAGRVSQLQVEPDGALWVASAGGLSRIMGNRLATLTTANGLPCEAVHWTIADLDRSLWLSMSCGLARISAAELTAWMSDPHRAVKADLLDAADGARNLAIPIGFSPPVARLEDGRLWFAGPNGVSAVDPRHLPFNALAPSVHIEQILADRTAYDTASANGVMRLPAHVHDLQIDYTALSLVAPDRVRFRYKLDPIDRDWQDVGKRRQAFYTSLPPRMYRFRVAAANDSGVWNDTGATVAFAIAPAYYQTKWFLAVSIASVIVVVVGVHRVRLRFVEKHQAEISALNERLMKAQEQERIRIAGELHDGVMQELLAATMMLGTAKRRIPADSAATLTLDKVQQKLLQAGTDLRQLSHDLHPPLLQEAGLPDAVQAYCEQFSAASNIPVACDAADDVRALSRGAALALFRIVQEALGNAAKHASARQIRVRLSRSDGSVSLTVSDDGVGLAVDHLAHGGGLGLVMMRERATQLNGRFDFESAPGQGTTIRVIVPFR